MNYTKKHFVQFYFTNIVDVNYVVEVDNMISVVVHNNPWLCLLPP